jgi:hypothetical protein
MLNLLLPILPSLGLLMMIVLGYFIFRTKVNEYNQKFSSMFSLLSAITDELKKLKEIKSVGRPGTFMPIEVDNNINETESNYSTEDDESDEGDNSGYQHDNESEDEENDDDEEENDDDEEENDEDENDKPSKEINVNGEEEEIASYNVEKSIENKEIFIHEENTDYQKMSLKELKTLAKSKGLSGDNNSKLKKSDLIELLTNNTVVLE